MKIKNKKNNQKGRSMVEMLAVLAISSVLAVTGITAYHYSINKHRANELIHRANMAYVDVISRESLDDVTELKTLDLQGNPLKGFIYNNAGFIIAESVEQDVCSHILQDKTNFALLTTKGSDLTKCDKVTSMIFSFSNATDVGFDCQNDSDCDENQYCSPNLKTCKQIETCDASNKEVFSKHYDSCMQCYNIKIKNEEFAPVYSNGECITCTEENKLLWNDNKKECVACLSHDDCPYDNDKNICVDNMCNICPDYSTTIETEQQIGDTPCYCESGYEVNDDNTGCQVTFDTQCAEGRVIVGNVDHKKYCVSNDTFGWSVAKKWCEDRGLTMKSTTELGCQATVNTYCENMNGLTDFDDYSFTSTPYGTCGRVYYCYYSIILSRGYVHGVETAHVICGK